jgi:thermostable 8-oxoguanine DNA glycosylase
MILIERIMHKLSNAIVTSIKHQIITTWRNGDIDQLQLPEPGREILPGVRWGKFDDFFTPAFWVSRSWIDGDFSPHVDYTLGRSLREEIAACLLGGHGMPAEVGMAAFHRMRDRGLLDGTIPMIDIEKALMEPLIVGNRQVRYRYPHTKSRFLAEAMQKFNAEPAPIHSPLELRNWLLTFSGIGPKTASWITRNSLHSDEVAILDIHIIRAGLLMGLFSPKHSVQRDYFDMEARLVAFARAAGVSLSRFDSIIWCYMRQMHEMVMNALTALPSSLNRA